MKILLIYLDLYSIYPPHYSVGVGSISAVLRQNGHHTQLSYVKHDRDIEKLLNDINEWKPDIVAFSSMSSMYKGVREIAKKINARFNDIYIVCGGMHPTVVPECLENTQGLDAICRGEGEYPMLDLADKMEKNIDFLDTKNFWFKVDGVIIKNELRPLIKDLDQLPYPDREIFDYQKLSSPEYMGKRGGPPGKRAGEFLFCRGCPFNCTYCSNHALRKLYDGAYVRYPSSDRALSELEEVVDKYCLEAILIHDDIITLNKNWFHDFFTKYRNGIRLPFVCNVRAGTFTEDMIRLLKEAGCHLLVIGIESGNNYIRESVLKRKMNDEQIIEAFEMAHKMGIRTLSQNMVGLPEETPEMFIDTIKLNARVKTSFPNIGIFHPYPGTFLASVCEKNGYILQQEAGFSERTDTVLNLPNFRRKDIIFYNNHFNMLVNRERRAQQKVICLERMIPMKPPYLSIVVAHEILRQKLKEKLERVKFILRKLIGSNIYEAIKKAKML